MVPLPKKKGSWVARKYDNEKKVPRPKNWSGWKLLPKEIEFWIRVENRIHERLKYTQNDSGKWKLFKDLTVEPTTTVDTTDTSYSKGTLVADIDGNVNGNVTVKVNVNL